MNSQYTAENIFHDVKVERFERHLFNKSYNNSFTCNHGFAIPFFVDDVVPGDRIDLKSYGRVQLQPLATATMQNIRAYMRYFYVPYRLIWDKWDDFISQDGFVQTPILAPYYTLDHRSLDTISRNVGGLCDMLGLGFTNVDSNGDIVPYNKARVSFTAFRHFAYWLIWDTYFRDENLQNKVLDTIPALQPGLNGANMYLDQLLPVAYEKDYFTTALPWRQKGEPVNLNAYLMQLKEYPYTIAPNTINAEAQLMYQYNNGIQNAIWNAPDAAGQQVSASVQLDPKGFATSININDLRYSNALQRYLERLALGGNRPAEFYLSMYGVKIDDLRIGQPLYLGGGYDYVHVNAITQTSETASTPQGTLAGNGNTTPIFGINSPYTCDEPGIVMGIFYLRPEINYSQGLPKQMTRFSHLDYYNPIFAHLGEEEVNTSELYIDKDLNNVPSEPELHNDDIFGYQSRYAYLKHRRNEVHGEFKTSLSHWLLSTHFDQKPELNSDFITVQQNYDIFAVVDETIAHHYMCEFRHNYQVESSMPDFVIPSL